jgi:hypothetical protein
MMDYENRNRGWLREYTQVSFVIDFFEFLGIVAYIVSL